jgi:hypothetical protein
MSGACAYLPDAMRTVFRLDERPRRPVHLREEHGAGGRERDGDARGRDGQHRHAAGAAVLEVVHVVVARLSRGAAVDLDELHVARAEVRRHLVQHRLVVAENEQLEAIGG